MWRSETVARLLQEELLGEIHVPVAGCILDSRQAKGGELFFALPGQKVDGHRFIPSAWQNGASVVIADKTKVTEGLDVPPGKAAVLVDSVPEALRRLAGAWRQEIGAKVVGITGSTGKTTTKDMVAAVLSVRYKVHKNRENNNNELGLPLTILNAPPDTEILVLEMGMRGLGEIKALCEIARPDTGVITNIGSTHMELLGSQENIARAKWELIEALPPGGTAILNAEDEWSTAMLKNRDQASRLYGIQGTKAKPEVYGLELQPAGALETTFTAVWGQERAHIHLPLPGEHNVLDALAALTVGTIFGVSLAQGAVGLSRLELSKMRLEVLPGIFNSILISDVYNANPASMQASLRILKERAGNNPTLAILGDMYELGDKSVEGHKEVGQTVAALGLDALICVGDLAENIASGAAEAGYPEKNISVCRGRSEAIEKVNEKLPDWKSEVWILIKGSRGMKMEEITARLQVGEKAGI